MRPEASLSYASADADRSMKRKAPARAVRPNSDSDVYGARSSAGAGRMFWRASVLRCRYGTTK